MKKAVIFDLDGTMWDSSNEVACAYNLALERLGYDLRFTLSDIRGAMGKTMVEIAHLAFDRIDPEKAVSIMQECINEENEYLKTHSGRVYDGLEEALSELKREGYLLACVSNCQKGYIEAFYESTGLGRLFDDKNCWGDTGLSKGENIKMTVARNGVERAIYVGDTMGDYLSAKDAGIGFIHAAYGFGEVPPGTPKIDSISELPERVRGILGERK